VKEGLGCQDVLVTAELYKLLIYEEGCFFLTHRNTEKTPGMFGTLVISLPCPHRGGELVIHHAGRQAVVDLSAADISVIPTIWERAVHYLPP
jgi:predicted 2-oxoglutarate/Fe(II)-dependent dioxygenase YbiX